MTGVELAPPADGLRWGRRCRAACVDRGVLIRPLGDVVVLMPPLTTTAAEIDRIVDALAASISEVCSREPGPGRGHLVRGWSTTLPTRPWAAWVDERLDEVRDAGRWRAHRDFDALGRPPVDSSRPDSEVVSFASNDYLGLTRHPAVVAAAHAALDRWGTGSGASRLVTGNRPVHDELEAELADVEGHRARRPVPHRLRRQPRRAHHARRPPAPASSATS